MTFHNIHQLYELHAEAQIRFVATVIFHSICPWHTLERFGQLNTAQFFEEVFCHTFEKFDYIVLLYERHFTVDLCKFRLTVGTQIFVTETFCNLEITVETGNHQQLLQGLWRLRQSVELSRVHTGRNHEVTGTLRG